MKSVDNYTSIIKKYENDIEMIIPILDTDDKVELGLDDLYFYDNFYLL